MPVLDEVPELSRLLEDLRHADRLIARVVTEIQSLMDTGLAEHATGLGLDHWIGLVGRRTRTDVRMLTTTATVLRRVPSLQAAFTADEVSWAQVRAVVLAVRPLPTHLDERIDDAIASVLAGVVGADPDALVNAVGWEIDALDDRWTRDAEADAQRHEYLAMQPRLDGTGGRLHGELGPVSWAVVDAALDTSAVQGDAGDGRTGSDDDARPPRPPHTPVTAGKRRLDRLVSILDAALAGGSATTAGPGSPGRPRSRPQLLLRVDLTTLLDRDQTPATLLTSVTGGHVRVTAGTARRLVEQRGADLRTIILDDTGSTVGVGRRSRVAPGWVRDAALAQHDTCSAPGCGAAARGCDIDHARPWHPARLGDLPGGTDTDNIGPLCAHHNRTKEADGWTVEQHADGSRRWKHGRSGLGTRTLPATWRPPRPSPGSRTDDAGEPFGEDLRPEPATRRAAVGRIGPAPPGARVT